MFEHAKKNYLSAYNSFSILLNVFKFLYTICLSFCGVFKAIFVY